MSEPAHPNPAPDAHLQHDGLSAYLHDLLEIGAKVAQSIGRQADRDDPAAPDLAEQFERVSRAMRRTILLIRTLAATPAPPNRIQARKRIIREVEDVIQRKTEDASEAEPLYAEFRDRLDSPDLDEEIAHRPIPDIIMDIRRDLGLEELLGNHPWQRRSPRDIEALRQRAATPRPPGPYDPPPHGPDPGALKPPRPPPDPAQQYQRRVQLARRLAGP